MQKIKLKETDNSLPHHHYNHQPITLLPSSCVLRIGCTNFEGLKIQVRFNFSENASEHERDR